MSRITTTMILITTALGLAACDINNPVPKPLAADLPWVSPDHDSDSDERPDEDARPRE